MPICPLCQNISEPFYKDEFYECLCCGGIFRPKEKLLDEEKEKERYDSHTNNSDDLGYQNFVSPITNAKISWITIATPPQIAKSIYDTEWTNAL